jgi:hypothetical protein
MQDDEKGKIMAIKVVLCRGQDIKCYGGMKIKKEWVTQMSETINII